MQRTDRQPAPRGGGIAASDSVITMTDCAIEDGGTGEYHGIRSIRVSASLGSMELDHLQYGLAPTCEADLDGDCRVGLTDLVTLLSSWGPCP